MISESSDFSFYDLTQFDFSGDGHLRVVSMCADDISIHEDKPAGARMVAFQDESSFSDVHCDEANELQCDESFQDLRHLCDELPGDGYDAFPMYSEEQVLTYQKYDSFDLTYSDADGDWCTPEDMQHGEFSDVCIQEDLQQGEFLDKCEIRAVRGGKFTGLETNVILDSGADASILPIEFARAGQQLPDQYSRYQDAQGHPLRIRGRRLVDLALGDGKTVIRDEFLVAPVSTPLLAIGKLFRSGWSLQNNEGQM